VLELRRAGATFDQIAATVGLASRGAAYKAHARALKATGGPEMDRERAREQDVDRLDRMLVVVWPRAMKGDLDAMREARQILRQRAGLLGLLIGPQTLLAGVDEPTDDDSAPRGNVVPPSVLDELRKEVAGVKRRGHSA